MLSRDLHVKFAYSEIRQIKTLYAQMMNFLMLQQLVYTVTTVIQASMMRMFITYIRKFNIFLKSSKNSTFFVQIAPLLH
jgi:hypothetical protein